MLPDRVPNSEPLPSIMMKPYLGGGGQQSQEAGEAGMGNNSSVTSGDDMQAKRTCFLTHSSTCSDTFAAKRRHSFPALARSPTLPVV